MRPTFLLGAVEPQRDPCHSSWGLGGLCAGLSTASVLPQGGLALLRFGKKSPQGQEEKEASIFVSKNVRP